MVVQIYLWRFNQNFENSQPFSYVTSEAALPKRIRLILPAPSAHFIIRTSFFEHSEMTYKGLPLYKETSSPERN